MKVFFFFVLITFFSAQNLELHYYEHVSSLTIEKSEIKKKEILRFSRLFPNSKYQKILVFDLAEILFSEKEYHLALAYYLRIAMLFPKHEKDIVNTKIRSILDNHEERDYEDYIDAIKSGITAEKSGKLQDDLFLYIMLLNDLEQEEHTELLIENAELFIKTFPNSINNDLIYKVIAATYERAEIYEEAIFHYENIVETFPDSEQLTASLYHVGIIYAEEFSNFSLALARNKLLYESFPKSEFAPDALLRSAKIYENEYNDFTRAIKHYRKFANTYPKHEKAVKSMIQIAEIYEDEDIIQSAINTYKEITSRFPNTPEAVDAQKLVIKFYKNYLNRVNHAIEESIVFSEIFSTHEDAAYILFEAGDLAMDELKDYKKAKEIYLSVQKKFSTSKYAKRANHRLNKLKKMY